ncbi:MAG: Cupin 2 conserved barrel domain protein [Geminicoccaceae bacterium]|nr:Cupin 2 conserved barrel domain protein [Geminicoccaceae bacterium]
MTLPRRLAYRDAMSRSREKTQGKSSVRAVEAIERPVLAGTGEILGSLGATIRNRRKQAELTLQEVADRAELSISYLSQVERNLLAPSLSTLKRIADILSIPAGQLMFAPDGNLSPSAPVGIVRRQERKRLSFPGSDIRYELLTPDMRRKSSLLWLSAPPGSESGPPFSHEGEDGVVMLKGQLDVEVGSLWHSLKAGDSIYFRAGLPHRWRNPGQHTAEAIWLSTPPSF